MYIHFCFLFILLNIKQEVIPLVQACGYKAVGRALDLPWNHIVRSVVSKGLKLFCNFFLTFVFIYEVCVYLEETPFHALAIALEKENSRNLTALDEFSADVRLTSDGIEAISELYSCLVVVLEVCVNGSGYVVSSKYIPPSFNIDNMCYILLLRRPNAHFVLVSSFADDDSLLIMLK